VNPNAPADPFPDERPRAKRKNVLVLGLGQSGQAACRLLLEEGAQVMAVDEADHASLQESARSLRKLGAVVQLGQSTLPGELWDLAVVSPGIPSRHPWIGQLESDRISIISELELGYERCLCLNISVTGTNGKSTTTGLIERVLSQNQMKTRVAGSNGIPVCSVAGQTRELDFLTLEVSAFQLERIRYFRSAVAVVLNITSDHMDRYGSMPEYVRAKARLLENQQSFDWTIIQSEVLARFQTMRVPIQSKVITFSANNRRADLHMKRGLLVSSIEGWNGPLLNMDHCQLRGPHNAENLMAALAVGRVLKIPLESMREPLQSFIPLAHRCEQVAEVNGVTYINDSKSTNVDSLHKALLSIPPKPGGGPNVWLIAGGREKGADYHDVGPLLSQRVKGAFLLGEARDLLRAAWSLFTPCTQVDSLLEAVQKAARKARAGDRVLLSPACSSFDQFVNYQHRGEVFREAVKELARTASEGSKTGHSG
jgi:UDP-N-acetylmuramoylalanine--D-glutamate ligase